ncbi:MAG: ferritin-like domain-containing protein [Caldilineaceae bacterium]|jgi:ferritin-like metal-binding protein YciE|nr:ferritin-like domain-containing protein [Caldilineaceae bacterium]MBK8797338.1 ferritin-like domain-containing protein [Anaerolineales bacterium]
MKLENLTKLYVEQLKDLYSAETQLVEALPKMAKAAHSLQLQQAFEQHLAETKTHRQRLEQIFEGLDYAPGGQKCKGMEGLIKEGEEHIKQEGDPETIDAGLIAAAQRVEHYEIAGYGTVHQYAVLLNDTAAAGLLQATLDEEYAADKKLTKLSESINVQAMQTS